MNYFGVFLTLCIIANELKCSQTSVSRTAKVDRFWRDGNSTNHAISPKFTSSNSTDLSTVVANSRQMNKLQRIPQVNFYSSIPNALGVIGQGIIWLREISAALGTPIPIWIFTIPFFILGIGLMFMPDLTQLSLPLFYPDGAGADRDPLAAFPPLPDMEDISSLNFMKQITSQLIPPKFIMERWG